MRKILSAVLLLVLNISCTEKENTDSFLKRANADFKEAETQYSIASWIHSNFITDDTAAVNAQAEAHRSKIITSLAHAAAHHKSDDNFKSRQLQLFKQFLPVPTPSSSAKNKELARLQSNLEGEYGKAKVCDEKTNQCKSLNELQIELSTVSDPTQSLNTWANWRNSTKHLKSNFQNVVEIGNQGAQELGFNNLADLWRSSYDMPAEEFEKEMDNLWGEVKPLYEQLHCFVRNKLSQKLGADQVPPDGPIPAHLLGNMWAQSWENLFPLLMDSQKKPESVTDRLKRNNYTPRKLVETAENFFVSLGLPKLPASFYQKSLFEKPKDRDVVCHASAWHMNLEDDVRIKMCIHVSDEDFRTIHHELGHVYYYLGYKHLPSIYQRGANDGFHEAIGDTVELSMTEDYLAKIGLKSSRQIDDPIPHLLNLALAKVAFLPFGLMIDKWRWQVFDGRTPPENYNKDWWKLRNTYQGISAPIQRAEDAFDPGAKYHIPGFVPYMRYFIAHILQFQLHRSLCKSSGFDGSLHECSIYESKAAGEKLWKLLQLGSSQPWQQTLQDVTGESKLDASALRTYFKPLEIWLSEQNSGLKCGW